MILVTGGTGLVGSHLLLKLVRSGLDVRATYRKNRRLEKAKRTLARYTEQAIELFGKIDWVEADINDLPALEKAFEGVTHVYHCAALISFDPKSYRKLRKAHG